MKTIRNTWAVVIAVWGLLAGPCPSLGSQNYVVSNDELTPMAGESETLIDFSHLETIGRRRVINGSLIILADMDNDNFGFTADMYTSPHGDGNYKKMVMGVPKTQVCEGFKNLYKEFIQPSFTHGENTNMPYIGDEGLCPIPAGEYYFKGIEFNTDAWPNQLPRGTLKVVVTFYKAADVIGGVTVLLRIEDDAR